MVRVPGRDVRCPVRCCGTGVVRGIAQPGLSVPDVERGVAGWTSDAPCREKGSIPIVRRAKAPTGEERFSVYGSTTNREQPCRRWHRNGLQGYRRDVAMDGPATGRPAVKRLSVIDPGGESRITPGGQCAARLLSGPVRFAPAQTARRSGATVGPGKMSLGPAPAFRNGPYGSLRKAGAGARVETNPPRGAGDVRVVA